MMMALTFCSVEYTGKKKLCLLADYYANYERKFAGAFRLHAPEFSSAA